MVRTFVYLAVIALTLGLALPAWAFDCPVRFQRAQAVIDKATDAMNGLSKGEKKALVHTLIDDAKMLLAGGIHNHEKPTGKYDHARAVAKADAARGYGEAALFLAKR